MVREVVPIDSPFRASVRVPASKSLAARALVAASLSPGESRITGALEAEDIGVLVAGLRRLGVFVAPIAPSPPARDLSARPMGSDAEEARGLIVRGLAEGSGYPAGGIRLDAADAGTAGRLFTALAPLACGPVIVDGSERMRHRPMRPLLDALRSLGCHARCLAVEGSLPVEFAGGGIDGGACRLAASDSSQFLTALLLAATRASRPVAITLDGLVVSRPYIDLTLAVGAHFSLGLRQRADREFLVTPGPGRGREYAVEADASSASYVFAAAAITSGEATVPGLSRRSAQPDLRFVDLLEGMGCTVDEKPSGLRVKGGPLRGISADLRDFPDAVPALASVAVFATGPTRISGVSHLRHKESDRLAALARELQRLGARVRETADGLAIEGSGKLHGAEVETYRDHRIAMALALIGLRVPHVRVRDPGCVGKSFPGFWSRVIDGKTT